jgi:glycosyltransferase involved in cell wall biosynthesis
MRVAIDARELCGHPTGVGRYLTGILDAWAATGVGSHEVTLVAHQAIPDAARWPFPIAVSPGTGGTLWEQLVLPRALSATGANVVFAPGYTASLTMPAPLVLTIHDVSYFAHPEWFSLREGFRRRLLTTWSSRKAHTVITDTAFSAGEIATHVGVPADRIRVVPLGITRVSTRAAAREPLVLYVGSIFERRRVDRLITAFDAVIARVPNARLEIVGENRTRRPHLDLEALRQRTAHPDRIALRSYVDDATLASLYGRASVFAFLSEYEGFGFTPLEALSAGVPPVLLDTPVARETCGEAARYVEWSAPDAAIATTIADLLEPGAARTAVLEHGPAVLAQYDWSRTAKATLAILEEAAGGR